MGYTQPGSSANTLTAEQGPNNAVLRNGLIGSGCASCVALHFNRQPVLVRGLATCSKPIAWLVLPPT